MQHSQDSYTAYENIKLYLSQYLPCSFSEKQARNDKNQRSSNSKSKIIMFEFDAVLHEIKDKGGAYVIFPWNIREVFGKGRVRVHIEFDSVPYEGSIVNMGVKDSEGNVCYIIGVLKSIRRQLGKKDGDTIHVVVKEL